MWGLVDFLCGRQAAQHHSLVTSRLRHNGHTGVFTHLLELELFIL